MFTIYRLAFTPERKPYLIVFLFTYKKGDFGAISATERSAAPVSKEEHHISDWFCVTLGAV